MFIIFSYIDVCKKQGEMDKFTWRFMMTSLNRVIIKILTKIFCFIGVIFEDMQHIYDT